LEDSKVRSVNEQVFNDDINRLLAMDDMWNVPGRVRPVALGYDSIMDDSFVTPTLRTAAAAPSVASGSGTTDGASTSASGANGHTSTSNGNARILKDQRELSIKENLELFIDRYVKPLDLRDADSTAVNAWLRDRSLTLMLSWRSTRTMTIRWISCWRLPIFERLHTGFQTEHGFR
jgi:hypothetical protein